MSKCFFSYYEETGSISPPDLEHLTSEVNNFVNNSIHDKEVQKQIIINVCWNALLYISKKKSIDYLSNRDFVFLTPILNIICDFLNRKTKPTQAQSLDDMTDAEYEQYLEESEERGGAHKRKRKMKKSRKTKKNRKNKKRSLRKIRGTYGPRSRSDRGVSARSALTP